MAGSGMAPQLLKSLIPNLCESLHSLFRQECAGRISLFCRSLSIWGWKWYSRLYRNISWCQLCLLLLLQIGLQAFLRELLWCHGALLLLPVWKVKRPRLLTLAQQRLFYQTQGNQDLPIIISEGSKLLAKTWWLRQSARMRARTHTHTHTHTQRCPLPGCDALPLSLPTRHTLFIHLNRKNSGYR